MFTVNARTNQIGHCTWMCVHTKRDPVTNFADNQWTTWPDPSPPHFFFFFFFLTSCYPKNSPQSFKEAGNAWSSWRTFALFAPWRTGDTGKLYQSAARVLSSVSPRHPSKCPRRRVKDFDAPVKHGTGPKERISRLAFTAMCDYLQSCAVSRRCLSLQ